MISETLLSKSSFPNSIKDGRKYSNTSHAKSKQTPKDIKILSFIFFLLAKLSKIKESMQSKKTTKEGILIVRLLITIAKTREIPATNGIILIFLRNKIIAINIPVNKCAMLHMVKIPSSIFLGTQKTL